MPERPRKHRPSVQNCTRYVQADDGDLRLMMFYCDQDEKEWQGAGGIPGGRPVQLRRPNRDLHPKPAKMDRHCPFSESAIQGTEAVN